MVKSHCKAVFSERWNKHVEMVRWFIKSNRGFAGFSFDAQCNVCATGIIFRIIQVYKFYRRNGIVFIKIN